MQGMGGQGENCPYEFNFEPDTFKPGDVVSYRVPDRFGDMPFVGVLISVHDDHVMLGHMQVNGEPDKPMRGTRESRPAVSAEDAL